MPEHKFKSYIVPDGINVCAGASGPWFTHGGEAADEHPKDYVIGILASGEAWIVRRDGSCDGGYGKYGQIRKGRYFADPAEKWQGDLTDRLTSGVWQRWTNNPFDNDCA